MAGRSSKLTCLSGYFLLLSLLFLQWVPTAGQPAHEPEDAITFICDRLEGASRSECIEGLPDATEQPDESASVSIDTSLPAWYLILLRWTKYITCFITACGISYILSSTVSRGDFASVGGLLSTVLLYPTFTLIVWLILSIIGFVVALGAAFSSEEPFLLILLPLLGSAGISLYVAALLLHLRVLPTLLWVIFHEHCFILVIACVTLGMAFLAFSLRLVMRRAAGIDSGFTLTAISLLPGAGCVLCCKGMSSGPLCQYVPLWFHIVQLTLHRWGGIPSCCVVQLIAAIGWYTSAEGSLLRALIQALVDAEPLFVFLDLICELAVVQFWRTSAAEKHMASLALFSGWIGLAVCGRWPAPFMIFSRWCNLGNLINCTARSAFEDCRQNWTPDEYVRATLTNVALILFLVFCLSGHSRGKRMLTQVGVLIRNTDLEEAVGPRSSAILRPVLRRAPTARRTKRLSDFPADARKCKRRRIDSDDHADVAAAPGSVLHGLWSAKSAEELREQLNKLVKLTRVRTADGTWQLRVRRSHLLFDTLAAFSQAIDEELLAARMKVTFVGEVGVDAGGVKRDFFTSVAKELRSAELLVEGPDQCLLPKPSPPGAELGPHAHEVQKTYTAVGRFIAVAVLQKQNIPLDFSHLAYKILLGKEVTVHDINAVDPEFFQHRIKLLLEPDGVQKMEAILMDHLFFTSAETKARPVAVPLMPDGENVRVTEENKYDYIRRLCNHYVLGGLRTQIEAIVSGFHHVLPLDVLLELSIDELDLGLMLAGIPAIDVEDWKAHTRELRGHSSLCKWFWDIVREYDDVQRARLLSFATGAARVPPGGFRAMGFKLGTDSNPEHLPTAHTCANMLVLPVVTSREVLKQRLDTVLSVSEDAAFGFA